MKNKNKKCLKMLCVCITVLFALAKLDAYLDAQLYQWYKNTYEATKNPQEDPQVSMPGILEVYVLTWKCICKYTPGVADILWERPKFGDRIPVEQFDIYYYGYGIDDDTVIEIKN